MITSQCRGHEIYFDGTEWRFVENNQVMDNKRPCKKCGQYPTKEGYDFCLGYIEGAKSACCGHGLRGKVIVMAPTPAD